MPGQSELCLKEAHPVSPIFPDIRYLEYSIRSHHEVPDRYLPETEVPPHLSLRKSTVHVPVRHYDKGPVPGSLPSPHEVV